MLPQFGILLIVSAAAVAAFLQKLNVSKCVLLALGVLFLILFGSRMPFMDPKFDDAIEGPTWQQEGERIGINPKIWGPSFWSMIHWVSIGYPEYNPSQEEQLDALKFITSLPRLLPCQICREHLKEHFENPELKPQIEHVQNRQVFGTYLVDLHDTVTRAIYESEGKDTSLLKRHQFPDDVFRLMTRVQYENLNGSADELQRPLKRIFRNQRESSIYQGVGVGILWAILLQFFSKT